MNSCVSCRRMLEEHVSCAHCQSNCCIPCVFFPAGVPECPVCEKTDWRTAASGRAVAQSMLRVLICPTCGLYMLAAFVGMHSREGGCCSPRVSDVPGGLDAICDRFEPAFDSADEATAMRECISELWVDRLMLVEKTNSKFSFWTDVIRALFRREKCQQAFEYAKKIGQATNSVRLSSCIVSLIEERLGALEPVDLEDAERLMSTEDMCAEGIKINACIYKEPHDGILACPWMNKAAVHVMARQWPRALRACNQAMKYIGERFSPTSSTCRTTFAITLRALSMAGRHDEIIDRTDAFAERLAEEGAWGGASYAPFHEAVVRYRTDALLATGQTARAVGEMRRIITSLGKDDIRATAALARALATGGNTDEASWFILHAEHSTKLACLRIALLGAFGSTDKGDIEALLQLLADEAPEADPQSIAKAALALACRRGKVAGRVRQIMESAEEERNMSRVPMCKRVLFDAVGALALENGDCPDHPAAEREIERALALVERASLADKMRRWKTCVIWGIGAVIRRRAGKAEAANELLARFALREVVPAVRPLDLVPRETR